MSLRLVLRPTNRCVSAWGRGTNSDKRKAMSAVKVLVLHGHAAPSHKNYSD